MTFGLNFLIYTTKGLDIVETTPRSWAPLGQGCGGLRDEPKWAFTERMSPEGKCWVGI